jgi:hypothetical protein
MNCDSAVSTALADPEIEIDFSTALIRAAIGNRT